MSADSLAMTAATQAELRRRRPGGAVVSARDVLREELRRLALTGLRLEEDVALDEAIPQPLAQQLCAAMGARGVECSWAPDRDDAELSWVYVTVDDD